MINYRHWTEATGRVSHFGAVLQWQMGLQVFVYAIVTAVGRVFRFRWIAIFAAIAAVHVVGIAVALSRP